MSAKDKTVSCPNCKGEAVYAASNPYRPFCGPRCKGMDLGAWANEEFSMAEQESSSDPDFERS